MSKPQRIYRFLRLADVDGPAGEISARWATQTEGLHAPGCCDSGCHIVARYSKRASRRAFQRLLDLGCIEVKYDRTKVPT